jgi:hypothetical protein
MKHHDVIQNSEDWYQLRAGRLTMSNLNKVMANFGKAFGEPAKKLAVDIAIEQITGEPIPSAYQNDAMSEGHVLEPAARAMYESEYFVTVENGGFFCDEFTGVSPDGICNNGLIEIKSSITPYAHFERVRKQSVDSAYRWQVAGALWCTGKEWLDFVSYCEFFPEDKRLFVRRYLPEMFSEQFDQITERVAEFKELVEKSKKTILEAHYI